MVGLGVVRGELSVCEQLVHYSSLFDRAFVRFGSSLSAAVALGGESRGDQRSSQRGQPHSCPECPFCLLSRVWGRPSLP